jgi:uncharacterized membrane protein
MRLDLTSHRRPAGAVIIRRPVETVFAFYRDFRNLPRFLGDVVHVELTGDRTSCWAVRTPFGFDVHWPVFVTEIRTNAFIAYEMQSLLAPVRWYVDFSPADGGVATTVRERMTIPGGKVAEIVFGALGKPPAREGARQPRPPEEIVGNGPGHNDGLCRRPPPMGDAGRHGAA